MKIATIACALAFLAAPSQTFAAPEKPLLTIVRSLENSGYAPITEVSRDNGGWEVEAYKGGIPYELLINPMTGAVISERRDDHDPKPPANARKLSEIIQSLKASGFSRITEVSFELNRWEVEAVRGGSHRELRVHPLTGAIVSDRIDD